MFISWFVKERDLKEFREGLKTELRLLRQEIDLMPKDKRKSAFRGRKEKLEQEHEERVTTFSNLLCLYCSVVHYHIHCVIDVVQ